MSPLVQEEQGADALVSIVAALRTGRSLETHSLLRLDLWQRAPRSGHQVAGPKPQEGRVQKQEGRGSGAY